MRTLPHDIDLAMGRLLFLLQRAASISILEDTLRTDFTHPLFILAFSQDVQDSPHDIGGALSRWTIPQMAALFESWITELLSIDHDLKNQGKTHDRSHPYWHKTHILRRCRDLIPNASENTLEMIRIVETILKLRHCIAHRDGWVSDKDVAQGEDLNIRLLGLRVFVDNLEVQELPKELSSGQVLRIDQISTSKSFPYDQQVSISPRDCADIALTFYFASMCLRDEYLKVLEAIVPGLKGMDISPARLKLFLEFEQIPTT